MASRPDSVSQAVDKELRRIEKTGAFSRAVEDMARSWLEAARWILDFQGRDLESYPNRDVLALGKQLRLFAMRVVRVAGVQPLRRRSGAATTFIPPVPTESDIRAIHTQLRYILGRLRPVSGKPTRAVRIPVQIQRVYLVGRGQSISRLYASQWPDWMWLAMAAVLEHVGSYIERCETPDCLQLFLRTRRQTFCSAQCSQRVRSQRWYRAHRNEAREQRREAYQKDVRRKLSARVKVQRRKGGAR